MAKGLRVQEGESERRNGCIRRAPCDAPSVRLRAVPEPASVLGRAAARQVVGGHLTMAEVELMPVGLIDDALAQRPIEKDRLVRATGRRCGWCSDGRSRWPAEPDEELEDGRDEEPLLERRARDEERVSSVRYHAGGGFEARPHTYRCVHVRPQPGAPPHHRLLGVHWLWGLLHAEGRERRNVRRGARCVQRPPGRREAADRHEHHRQAEKSAQHERASHRARASRHVRPAHGGRWVCLSLRRFGARDDGWMGRVV